MTRKSSTTWDTKPHKGIFYSPAARFVDWRAGRRDGDLAIPDLPAGPVETVDPRAATDHPRCRPMRQRVVGHHYRIS